MFAKSSRRRDHVTTASAAVLLGLFAWSGGFEPGEGHYYRIQTPSFLFEYDNSQNGANHVHAVWRQFDGDFGADLLRLHYETSSHHTH